MSRIAGGEVRTIAPSNNVYTALAAAAFLIQLVGFIALFMKASSTVGNLFQ